MKRKREISHEEIVALFTEFAAWHECVNTTAARVKAAIYREAIRRLEWYEASVTVKAAAKLATRRRRGK